VTIIWRAGVFTAAFGDYLFFGQKLEYFYIIGLIAITGCIIVLNLKNFDGSVSTTVKKAEMEPWIPISCAIAFPILITWNNILTKYMTQDKIGFNPSRVTYFTFGLMNILILAFAIPIWLRENSF
jgi:drug/metabolite transporter (DMT)-like permease